MAQAPLTLRRWNRTAYQRLVDLGLFRGDPVELIAGQLDDGNGNLLSLTDARTSVTSHASNSMDRLAQGFSEWATATGP